MCCLTRKIFKIGAIATLLAFSAATAAEVNPFKKSKNYKFGNEVNWYEKDGSAMKSGAIRDGSDINYYHLNINKSRLLLRLGKNDPSGELQNTRILEALAIADVSVDGSRLPVFDWCLRNQQNPARKLKQNAVVANDTCVNAGSGGDFVINLDAATRDRLMQARMIEFEVEPYGRPVRMSFTMNGFAPIMAEILRPPAPKVVAPPIAKPAPLVKPVVVAKPKPKPKPKPVKMCRAVPPAEFQSQVKGLVYPCDNVAKKQAAESGIAASVAAYKKKLAAQKEAERLKALEQQKLEEDSKREQEWDKKQDAMWISRCQRHWSKGKSPCYCEKYLDQAPPGVKNTCGN